MRRLLTLAVLLPLAACSSSKETSDATGSTASERPLPATSGGGLSGGLLGAIAEAVNDDTPWTPPKASGGLRWAETRSETWGGHPKLYRYSLSDGSFDTLVYQRAEGADEQLQEMEDGLNRLVENGKLDAVSVAGRESIPIVWEGDEATLHRLTVTQTVGGASTESYMYLLEDGDWWVRVLAMHPEGRYALADMDEMVVGFLTEDDE